MKKITDWLNENNVDYVETGNSVKVTIAKGVCRVDDYLRAHYFDRNVLIVKDAGTYYLNEANGSLSRLILKTDDHNAIIERLSKKISWI